VVDLDCTDDRKRFAAVHASYGKLLPDEAPPPEQLRGYLYADDSFAVDASVRRLMPAAIRSWAQTSAKGHRLRWGRRADWFETLPPVQSWPVTTALSMYGGGTKFGQLRIYRTPPWGWEEIARRITGTGGLGWLFWAIGQLSQNAGWIEPVEEYSLRRHDYLEDILRFAEPFLGRRESVSLISPGS